MSKRSCRRRLYALVVVWFLVASDAEAGQREMPARSTNIGLYVLDDEPPTAIIVDIGEQEIVVEGGTRSGTLRGFLESNPDIIDGPIELAIVTRAANNSWRGLQSLFERYRILEFWEQGYHRTLLGLGENTSYRQFLTQLRRVVPPDRFKSPLERFHPPAVDTGETRPFAIETLPGIYFTVLNSDDAPPTPDGMSGVQRALLAASSSTPVILLQIGTFRMLFASGVRGKSTDAGAATKAELLEARLLELERRFPGTLKADVLIVPDDGSEAASTEDFINAVEPGTAIFTAAPLKGLPQESVVSRYSRISRVLSTGVHAESNRDHIVCNIELSDDEKRHSCSYADTGWMKSGRGDEPEWRGRDGKGNVVTAANLPNATAEDVVSPGRAWERADLAGAPLQDAVFANLNLSSADLSWADLARTDFSDATMANAKVAFAEISPETNFTGSILSNVDFRSIRGLTRLRQARLDGANLEGVDLQNADLTETDLTKADLRNAHLPKLLQGTVLTGARLQGVDLTDTVFELRPGAIPEPSEFAVASYLKTLRFESSPHSLVELREALKRAGLRDRERELTYAIERQRNISRGPIFRWINRLLFDATVAYGMHPSRALVILGGFIFLFTVLYAVALQRGGEAKIRIRPLDAVVGPGGGEAGPTRLTVDQWVGRDAPFARGLWVVFVAMYFSLISAFQVGFRELNIGTWLSRIQPREFTIEATGWVRVVSGIQSLVSVYLLALWLLTYFGRPFE